MPWPTRAFALSRTPRSTIVTRRPNRVPEHKNLILTEDFLGQCSVHSAHRSSATALRDVDLGQPDEHPRRQHE